MWTILPLIVLLALSLASCSSSANSLTGPPDDINPTMEPDRQQPSQPCAAPASYHGLAGRSTSLSVSLGTCTLVTA
jgi:hypothetical protein